MDDDDDDDGDDDDDDDMVDMRMPEVAFSELGVVLHSLTFCWIFKHMILPRKSEHNKEFACFWCQQLSTSSVMWQIQYPLNPLRLSHTVHLSMLPMVRCHSSICTIKWVSIA